jgi:hypothetical protein
MLCDIGDKGALMPGVNQRRCEIANMLGPATAGISTDTRGSKRNVSLVQPTR